VNDPKPRRAYGVPVHSSARHRSRVATRFAPLDGIRAFAVAFVCAFHGGLSWAPGGLFGVDIFFVLSGYLITGLLLSEHSRTGGLKFARGAAPSPMLHMWSLVLVAESGPDVQLVSANSLLSPNGKYATNDPQGRQIRSTGGIHVVDQGGAEVGDLLPPQLLAWAKNGIVRTAPST
jgi:hypothetical protein